MQMTTLTLRQDRATISSKGQVVIPRFLRKVLGLHAGSELIFEMQADQTVVVKPTQRNINMLFGCCKSTEPPLSTEDMDHAISMAVLNETLPRKKST